MEKLTATIRFMINLFIIALINDGSDLRARCVTEDTSGAIWIGAENGELFNLDNSKNEFFKDTTFSEQLKADSEIHLHCLYADKSGTHLDWHLGGLNQIQS